MSVCVCFLEGGRTNRIGTVALSRDSTERVRLMVQDEKMSQERDLDQRLGHLSAPGTNVRRHGWIAHDL